MVPSDPKADDYRRRAGDLRRLADRLGAVPLSELVGSAGTDTWSSAGADECCSMASRDRQRVTHAIDDLRQRAWRFEREADALDAAAAATPVVVMAR